MKIQGHECTEKPRYNCTKNQDLISNGGIHEVKSVICTLLCDSFFINKQTFKDRIKYSDWKRHETASYLPVFNSTPIL